MGKNTSAKKAARGAERVDVTVGKAAAVLRHHPIVGPVTRLGELADQPPLFALCAATLAAGVVLRRPAVARTGLRMMAAHALATFAKGWVKHRVDRQRPRVAGGDHRVKPGRIVDHSDHNSFPSGHSAGAVAVACAVVRDHPALAGPAAAAAGFAVLIQLPAAKHFPLDLVAGAAIGLAAEAIVEIATDPRRLRGVQLSAAQETLSSPAG